MVKKFVTAVEESEGDEDRGTPVVFELDGREIKSYPPHEGQLTFMLATLGRGQTDDQRYAAVVNIMLSTLRGEDRDYLESRLLTEVRKDRLRLKQLEEIFEYLVEEWFADPTRSQSDSAESESSASENSALPTT